MLDVEVNINLRIVLLSCKKEKGFEDRACLGGEQEERRSGGLVL